MKYFLILIFIAFNIILKGQDVFLPIKPARTILIETDEGSYMNVDISPNGKTLAFDLLGDLFTMPVNGGRATQVTSGIALNRRPVWSPDGKRIIYRSDLSGNYSTYSVAVGDGKIQLYNNEDVGYDSLMINGYIVSGNRRWKASIVDTMGRRSLVIEDIPKNTKRVFVSSLIKDSFYMHRPPAPPQHFCFSPDAKYLFISYEGKIHRLSVESGRDDIIPFKAKVKADLGEFNYHKFKISEGPFKIHYIRSASLSPSKNQIVFTALNKIYVYNTKESKAASLLNHNLNQYQPAYSSDGKWIAYVTWNDTAGGQLWRVSAAGGIPEQITTTPGQYQRPSWSHDGRSIAVIRGAPRFYDRDEPGSGFLEVIDVQTKTIKVVDSDVPLWNQLSFSKNGNCIIYTPADTGSHDQLRPKLISKNLQSGNVRIWAIGSGSLRNFSQHTLSLDERFIAYTSFENMYVHEIADPSKPVLLYEHPEKNYGKKIGEGIDPVWSYDGRILNWTYGTRLYSVPQNKLLYNPSPEIIDLDVEAEEQFAKGIIAFTNATIITMSSRKVIDRGTVIIEEGRIVKVGEVGKISIPKGAKVVDLEGKTIMPGMVDLHCHMRVPSNVFPQQSWMFLINLAYGVTTARDPALSYDSYGYAELLRTGQMMGPRLVTVGRAITRELNISSFNAAQTVIAKRKKMGGIAIKQYMLPTRLQRQWLLLACREAGLNMTNEGAFDPIEQIGMIKDGGTGIEHNPLWGDVYNDIVQFFGRSGIFFTPTLQIGAMQMKEYLKYKYWQYPNAKLQHFTFSDTSQDYPPSNGAATIENIFNIDTKDTAFPGITNAVIDARFRKAGGNVCLGSHGNDEGIGAHNELWSLQMGGLTNLEALEAATILGAKALGLDSDIGSIENGKIADLLVLNKNPLDDIHNSREIMYVMKNGVLYESDTLNTIWPTIKKCPEWRLKNCF